MNILAVIPARAGSKGIPNKNIRIIGEHPLVYYSIRNAIDSQIIRSVIVSTDSPEVRINVIFGLSSKPYIKEKLIILDQPKKELFNEEDIIRIGNIYNQLAESIGHDEVIVKKHPRSSAEDYQNIRYFESTGIPFELFCLNINMNDKILVSHSSTAVTTPKILFDQEPTVIVLTKLLDPITGEKNLFEDFFQAVRNTYHNKNKFLIPSSIEELNEIVSALQI